MQCPKCGSEKTGVVKKVNGLNYDLRERYCDACKKLFTSFEMRVEETLYIELKTEKDKCVNSPKSIFRKLSEN